MGLTKLIMKKAVPLPKIGDFERYLFIGPHPDDIEIGAGATAARLAAAGKHVFFLICTDGRYGTEDRTADTAELVKTRQKEARESAAIIGAEEVVFLPFPDGGDYTARQLCESILPVISRFQPDVIFAPDSHMMSECHGDHIKVGQAVANAFLISENFHQMKDGGWGEPAKCAAIAFYFTSHPNTRFKTNQHFNTAIRALKCFKSQFPIENDSQGIFKSLLLYIKLKSLSNARFLGKADAFRVLGKTHSHCAPDADKF